jgi:hypothetical protein
VGDELKVLKYKETINNYYTAEANPETIIVSDDRHEATINYTRKIANVKFVDWDSVLLDEQSVPYGEAATAPEDEPFREGYEFIGWSVGFSKVESDLRVVAEYAKDDHNAPTITIEGEPLFIDGTASKNSEWGYDWNITVRAVDDNDDVKSLKYAWTQSSIPPVDLSNIGDEITSGTVIKGPDVTDSGLYYLHVYAKDYFDNATQVYETFSFDRTVPDEPEISARKAGFRRYVTINYDEIDAHSGVYIVEYSLRDKITQKYGEYNEYTGEVEINTILYFTSIKVKVTDNVGNSMEYEIPESSFDYSTALMPFSAPLDVNTTMFTAVEEEVKEEIGQEDQQESAEEAILNTEEDEEVEQNIEDNNNIQEEGDANNMYNDNDLDDNDYDDSDDLNDDEDFQAEVNDDEESEGENDVDVNGEENVDAEENEDADEDVDLDTDADIDSDNENGDEDTDTDDIDFPEEEDADLEQ